MSSLTSSRLRYLAATRRPLTPSRGGALRVLRAQTGRGFNPWRVVAAAVIGALLVIAAAVLLGVA